MALDTFLTQQSCVKRFGSTKQILVKTEARRSSCQRRRGEPLLSPCKVKDGESFGARGSLEFLVYLPCVLLKRSGLRIFLPLTWRVLEDFFGGGCDDDESSEEEECRILREVSRQYQARCCSFNFFWFLIVSRFSRYSITYKADLVGEMSFVAISWFGPPRSEHEAKFHFLLSIDFTDLWLSLVFPPSLHNLFARKEPVAESFTGRTAPLPSHSGSDDDEVSEEERLRAWSNSKSLMLLNTLHESLSFAAGKEERESKGRILQRLCYPRRYSVLSAAFVVNLDRLFESWFRGEQLLGCCRFREKQ